MTNPKLADDYKKRAKGRKVAIDALFSEKLYADVVRECQEAAELALKAIIREVGHSIPFTHDVSEKLKEIEKDLPTHIKPHLQTMIEISKSLRRDRELSFYGSEDVTPSDFYTENDAKKAIEQYQKVISLLK